jgi:2-polyprenyl-6-methoxyphenol hydroxylase-like FAD-dependent oxidoreductase
MPAIRSGRMKRRALVVGGGIGGLTAAVALRGAGFEVVVLERESEPREVGAGISLWPNAVNVLRQLGVGDAVEAVAVAQSEGGCRTWRGRRVADAPLAGTTARHGPPLLMLHRASLRAALSGALDRGVLQLSAECTSVDQDAKWVSVTLADGRSVQGDVVIGADGVHSRVRAVTFDAEAPRYSGFTAWRGIVPLDDMLASRIRPAESWSRGGLFGLTRLGGSQAFWYAIARAPANEGGLAAEEKAILLRRFGYWHDPIPELIDATAVEAIVRTSLYDRPPLARWAAGRIALIGDAARGMLPNLAQGGWQAIEDGAALADALRASSDDGALAAYDSQRREHAAKFARRERRLPRVAHLRARSGSGCG